MSVSTITRPPPTYTAQPQSGSTEFQQDGSLVPPRRRRRQRKRDPPPLVQKVGLAAQVYGLQGLTETMMWFQGWREWLYPPDGGPNIVKAYEVRPGFGVRIFFPASYNLTSPQTLPTVLTIHGGGFCLGVARDDDGWNRAFADSQNMLVVSLPYSKAPRAPFPVALHDLEALYLAVLGDESLPIDRATSTGTTGRGRISILGYDSGGNLALSLSQLPKVRKNAVPPTAVVSISGYLDLERPVADKAQNRPYKPGLPWPQNGMVDPLAKTYEAYVWSYTPYQHDLRDPLLSPTFATWADEGDGGGGLPRHVCLVGAELDMLAHESWRLACRLVRDGGVKRGDGLHGRWIVPDPDADDPLQKICGKVHLAQNEGLSEPSQPRQSGFGQDKDDDLGVSNRFGFEVCWENTSRSVDASVKWILVPDVLHGFDRVPSRIGTEPRHVDTHAYVEDVGRWLRKTVWAM